MKVYHDFFTYKTGIYKHSPLSSADRTGYHSVRIVGWGEEYTSQGIKKYWVRLYYTKTTFIQYSIVISCFTS
jgi:hypothetical protein